uniref:Uncharacterized protein n=1 Tax=Rousettus aegyptiacus TaxID=9407 RepID=A0A7J8DIV3_ROUAE|nr:hypothetical protein HJG63_008705 [Rousettus aegyptiacus]
MIEEIVGRSHFRDHDCSFHSLGKGAGKVVLGFQTVFFFKDSKPVQINLMGNQQGVRPPFQLCPHPESQAADPLPSPRKAAGHEELPRASWGWHRPVASRAPQDEPELLSPRSLRQSFACRC